MTREDAINTLKSLKEYYNDEDEDHNYIGFDKLDNMAIDTAIKALEQELVLDKVRAEIERERSFQRAIDEYDKAAGLRKALEIIDKYKAESEEEE